MRWCRIVEFHSGGLYPLGSQIYTQRVSFWTGFESDGSRPSLNLHSHKYLLQNLTDILIDDSKFQEMQKNMYDAIDTDNESTI